jgi:uncharacterized protein
MTAKVHKLSIRRFIKVQIRRLRDIRGAPEAVSGGVAIGMFFGFTPFFGIKTLLAIVVAWILRCSKMAAAIAVTLHDLLIPVAPFVLWMEYNLGYWVLSSPHQWPSKIHLEKLVAAESLHMAHFLEIGKPLIVGSLIVGTTAAAISYFATHVLLKNWEETHHPIQLKPDE